ncbi:class I SAM-dependent methyltransferase [Micromonospora sp. NPDC047793]|uniref:class I SAM-dependent methyltransferase n=1 Tax=Micromonospora sp. NPDC047793 TaxID=3154342 RepID=UPI0033F43558
MSESTYLFHDTTGTRPANAMMLNALADLYDPFSRRRLREAGVRPDARCLVVAAGRSRVAAILAEMAPQGEVIATDIDLSPCRRHPRVTLLEHNIVTDPLPGGMFDLIHVRLLLGHLPADHRETVLTALVNALTPGGLLFVEEFEATWQTSVLSAPNLDDADRLFTVYHHAFQAALIESGNDPRWGRRAHHALRRRGLTVDTRGDTGTWTGGSPACLLPHATTEVIRPRLIAAGMPPADIDSFRQLLHHRSLVVKSNLALSHIGRHAG